MHNNVDIRSCPLCGGEIKKAAQFCKHCRHPVPIHQEKPVPKQEKQTLSARDAWLQRNPPKPKPKDESIFVINLRGAIKALETGNVSEARAKLHFVWYVGLLAVVLFWATIFFGQKILMLLLIVFVPLEGVMIAIAYAVNSSSGKSEDFWGRYFTTGFPCIFRVIVALFVGVGIVLILTGGGVITALSSGANARTGGSIIAMGIIGICVVVLYSIYQMFVRFAGIARVAKAHPEPTGLFNHPGGTETMGIPIPKLRIYKAENAAPAPSPDFIETLESISTLKNEGILSDAEFGVKRAELVNKIVANKQNLPAPELFLTKLIPFKNSGVLRDEDIAVIKQAIL